jgi:hypothetical protein
MLSFLSVVVLCCLLAAPAEARALEFDTLRPGEFMTYQQTIPVNLVFVGYKNLNTSDILGKLPASYQPIVRFPRYYGLNGRQVGLHFDYTYRTINTDTKFEGRFFNYLKEIGQRGPLTAFQQAYNDQEKNVLDVKGPVLYIDAPSVEKWLESRSGTLGIDTRHSYTVYFINWHGREDFKFHVYTKADEPEPGSDLSLSITDAQLLIAWGGTTSRSWFLDLSAGPEFNSTNWAVDTPDLDGDGVEDYRMPPVWEYAQHGYRNRSQLDDDLGLITRYAAINLLFTSSPMYDPLVTAPGLGGKKVVHVELFEDDPNTQGIDFLDKNIVLRELRRFEPYYDWQVSLERNNPIDPQAQRALQIYSGALQEDDCWNEIGVPQAELFCFFTAKYDQYIPQYSPHDYVGESFAFNTTPETMGNLYGVLGYAENDWSTGTQTYNFLFSVEAYRRSGYGLTSSIIHEFGHHIGMSHPHDGYDFERDVDYGPGGEFYFTWLGDEGSSVMSYMGLNNGFSEFDRANMHRYEFAGYLNWSNALLGDILASPDAQREHSLLRRADELARSAQHHFEAWDYVTAARDARRAYERLLTAAEKLGVETPAVDQARRMLPNPSAPRPYDPIRTLPK